MIHLQMVNCLEKMLSDKDIIAVPFNWPTFKIYWGGDYMNTDSILQTSIKITTRFKNKMS